ncbi:hypothetical protein ANN_03851 [Periplaneta americana]|uniref:VWFD domain-containing protein n=1 Tax=Periplaneta americana TaxID=6978 RepID=A0ABQ8U3G3_PERAM|nr:hypothetical protein ANN_03851 [Periplaneta americana]
MADRRHRADTCRQALLSLVREAGFSATEAGRRLGVHDSTARRWVRLSREGNEHRQPGSGRICISTPAQDAALVAEVEANPHQSASSIKVNARFPGSSRTVIRRLRDVGRYPRVAAMKGCITDDHRLFRLAFAEENVNFDWNKWPCICSMLGWMSSDGLGVLWRLDGNLNAQQYKIVLENVMLPSVRMIYPDDDEIISQQDNHRVHTCAEVMSWFTERPYIRLIEWPPCSPDLNVLENVWSEVKKTVNAIINTMPRRPTTKDALWNIIEDTWDRVSSRQQYLRCLIASIPRRMQASPMTPTLGLVYSLVPRPLHMSVALAGGTRLLQAIQIAQASFRASTWEHEEHPSEVVAAEGNEHRQPGSGRICISTPAQDAALVTEVEANPHQSASSIKVNARFPGSSRTVIRRLRDVGRYPRVAAMKGCITDDHRLFRLAFAEENVNFDWNKWPCICSMLGWMSSDGLGVLWRLDGNLNAQQYKIVLENVMLPSVRMIYPDDDEIISQQDNHRVHTCAEVMSWFTERPYIRLIEWPPCSPDLNVLENVWSEVKKTVNTIINRMPRRPTTKDALWNIIEDTWDRVSSRRQCLRCLIASIPLPKWTDSLLDLIPSRALSSLSDNITLTLEVPQSSKPELTVNGRKTALGAAAGRKMKPWLLNTQFPPLLQFATHMGAVDLNIRVVNSFAGTCVLTSSTVWTLDGANLTANIPTCYTLALTDCSSYPHFALFVKKVEGTTSPLAIKLYLQDKHVEVLPIVDHVIISVNDQVIASPQEGYQSPPGYADYEFK